MDEKDERVYAEAPYSDTYRDRYGVLVGSAEIIPPIGRHVFWTHPSPDHIDGTTWLAGVYDDDGNVLRQTGEHTNFMEAVLSMAVALSPLSRPE